MSRVLLMYFLYNFFLMTASVVCAPYFSIKLVSSEKYREGLGQRMGRLPLEVSAERGEGKCLWVHAVSVGEVLACAPLIEELKGKYPELRIVLSTVTRTGNQTAVQKVKAADQIIYFPFDFPWTVRKVIREIAPDAVAIVETELWPNFLRRLRQEHIPSLIVNGRISPSSFRGYKKVRFFIKNVLAEVNLFSMQSEEDARRVVELGADGDAVEVTGNVKFDQSPSQVSSVLAAKYRDMLGLEDQRVFLAGSTHEGEEEAVIEAYDVLREEFPDLRLIIAPRHPERWDRVEKLIADHGYDVRRRSGLEPQSGKWTDRSVVLLDTIGELAELYAVATAAFVGGSLVPTGGHNVLEAAAQGKAVLFGPHMFNFKEISRLLLEVGGGLEVQNTQDMVEKIRRLLHNTHDREDMGRRALSVVHANQGAVKRNVELLERYLNLSTDAA